jgi:hypothetical protein
MQQTGCTRLISIVRVYGVALMRARFEFGGGSVCFETCLREGGGGGTGLYAERASVDINGLAATRFLVTSAFEITKEH